MGIPDVTGHISSFEVGELPLPMAGPTGLLIQYPLHLCVPVLKMGAQSVASFWGVTLPWGLGEVQRRGGSLSSTLSLSVLASCWPGSCLAG